MEFRGYTITARLIGIVVIALLVAAVIFGGPAACSKMRSMAAQGRMDRSQGEAHANSSADAVNTVAASGEASAASEALTRSNEEEIRNAKGSNQAVDPAARNAGLASLCRRAAYRDDPKCRVQLAHP
jgi:hypothetical protein